MGPPANSESDRVKVTHRACPVCENSEPELWHRVRLVLPDLHPLDGGYVIVICRKCGMVFADTAVSQSEYDRYYAELSKYQDQSTSTGGGGSPADQLRLRACAVQLANMLPDKSCRILDVGCGNGGLLRALQELGYQDVTGVDPSSACVENTRRATGRSALVGVLGALPSTLGQFDLIILSHVLEHVRDVAAAVESLRHHLLPGGRVYFEVPDALRYSEFLQAPFQDFNTEHINHFSLASLHNLARRLGWRVLTEGTKVLCAGTVQAYPAAFVQLQPDPSAIAPLIEDRELEIALQRYVRLSEAHWARIQTFLGELVDRSPELILWGIGQLAFKLLADTPLSRARFRAFVDGNPVNHGLRMRGQPVISPEKLPPPGSCPILITTLLHHEAIKNTIRQRFGDEVKIVVLPTASE